MSDESSYGARNGPCPARAPASRPRGRGADRARPRPRRTAAGAARAGRRGGRGAPRSWPRPSRWPCSSTRSGRSRFPWPARSSRAHVGRVADQVRGRRRVHGPDAAGVRADAVPAADAAGAAARGPRQPARRSARLSAREAPPAAGHHRARATRGTRSAPRSCSSPSARRPPQLEDWPVYVAALAAQCAFDFVVTPAASGTSSGCNFRSVVRDWAWVSAVDALLVADRAAGDVLLARGRLRPAAGPAGDRTALHLRPRAPARAQQRAAAAQRVPGHDDPARRPDRGRRRVHGRAQQDRRLAVAAGRGRDRPVAARTPPHRVRRAAARRRQDRRVEGDHQQAGAAELVRARGHEDPHDRGRADAAAGRRLPGRGRPDRARLARALGRVGLPRRPAGRGDPDRGADRVLLRRLQRDDDDALIPHGALHRRRAGGGPPQRRHPVRPAGRGGARAAGRGGSGRARCGRPRCLPSRRPAPLRAAARPRPRPAAPSGAGAGGRR